MKVAEGLMVRCEYDLRVAGGEVIESSSRTGPIVYKHGGGKLLPALEAKLDGMGVGDERSGVLTAAEVAAAGPTLSVPRAHFPEGAAVEVGQVFEAKDPQGRPLRLEVEAVDGDAVRARAVHPLAGKDLEYRVKVLEVREPPPPVPRAPAALESEDLIEAPPSDPALPADPPKSEG